MTLFVELTILSLLILLNGVLAMSELALVSARKTRLERQAKGGKRSARIALKLASAPNDFLATVQIGITLVGILAGAFGEATLAKFIESYLAQVPLLAPYSQALSLALVVIAITYLSLVFGELVPKRLALNNPERIAQRVAPGMDLLSRITAPLSRLLSRSTDLALRLIGGGASDQLPVTEEDIKALVREGAEVGVVQELEQRMVSGVFRLGDRRANALLTPRTEIEWLDIDEPFSALRAVILSSSHTVFPVGRGSLDKIIGVISAKDLLSRMIDRPDETLSIADLKQPLWTPDSTPALQLLERFQQSGCQMALVIDEFGGLSGLITPQDILDSIYGDTFPVERAKGAPDQGGYWLLSGLTSLDQLSDILPIEALPALKDKRYQTLGGMIATHLGRIPRPADRLTIGEWRFEVITMDRHRVDQVRVARHKVEQRD